MNDLTPSVLDLAVKKQQKQHPLKTWLPETPTGRVKENSTYSTCQ